MEMLDRTLVSCVSIKQLPSAPRHVLRSPMRCTGLSSIKGRMLTLKFGDQLSCSSMVNGRVSGVVESQHEGLSNDAKWQQRKRTEANCFQEEGQEVDALGYSSSNDVPIVKKGGGNNSFLTFLCPLLKLVGGGDPAAPRNTFLEAATSGLASIARLPWGSWVNVEVAAERKLRGQPLQPLQVYEFEACPFCRRVREALTELDLTVEVYPCPKGSLRHREFVRKNGGYEQADGACVDICLDDAYRILNVQEKFPYFVDRNTGVALYESSEIVKYLFRTYGGDRQPTTGLLESTLVTGWVPTIVRAGRGLTLYSKANLEPPPKKLELFSYENNQFARLVREALCELELPYILWNSGKGSSSRSKLRQLAGSTEVPYLLDPNTGRSMAESSNIVAYLFETYGARG